MQLPDRNFSEMDLDRFDARGMARWIAVLPLGATEYHGRHLPAETDAIIAAGVAGRLADRLPPSLPVTFLPVERIGYSPEHLDRRETLSLGHCEAIERWTGIGTDLAAKGIRKLVLLNAHGGNSPLLSIVATELRIRENMLCVATSWTRFGVPDGLIGEEEVLYGVHGGEIETSVMLALSPDRVDMAHAGAFDSRQRILVREYRYLRAYGSHAFGWKMSDLNPAGIAGDSSRATAEKGEKLLEHAVSGLAGLIGEVDRFELETVGEHR